MDANIRNRGIADSRLFTYSRDYNSFGCEMSTLSLGYGIDPLAQLYHDACDQGFLMKSHATGNVVIWYLSSTEKDNEGDTTHWVFKPTMASIHHNPQLETAKVLIWNT